MKNSKGDFIFGGVVYVLYALIAIVTLYPLLYVLSASFSDPQMVISGDVWFLPKGFNINGYIRIFAEDNIMRGYLNSIIILFAGTAVNVIMTMLLAYPLSRRDLAGRNAFMLFVAFTMYFSGGTIPTYMLIRNLGLVDSYWVLIIPGAISTHNMIVMRTYFQNNIPIEMQEAAYIDGCSNTKLFLQIVVPLSMPILAIITLFYAISHWNAYFDAMIYLRDEKKYPLQLVLRSILLQSELSYESGDTPIDKVYLAESIKFSSIVVASVPVLLLYPFVQKHFVKGVMVGAVKG